MRWWEDACGIKPGSRKKRAGRKQTKRACPRCGRVVSWVRFSPHDHNCGDRLTNRNRKQTVANEIVKEPS